MAIAATTINTTQNGQVVQFPSITTEIKERTNPNFDQHVSKEVFALELNELKMMLDHFSNNELWMHYMLFTVACNTGRRASDILNMKWNDFFNADTGKFYTDIDIREKKTSKYARIYLNDAVKSAVLLYIEKVGCDPSENNYENKISLQVVGTHKGKELSYSGYRTALKKAAAACGIEKNVGTHSARKSFGKLAMELHPNDPEYLAILSEMFNHSSERITRRYIGLTKVKFDECYADIGKTFQNHVFGDDEYKMISGKPVVSIESADLRALIQAAYKAGMNNAGETDCTIHLDTINSLIENAENLIK